MAPALKSTITTCSIRGLRQDFFIEILVVKFNMFPLSLQVLCFRCTFAILQTALTKCTCDANKKTNHDGPLSYVFFARFILAIDQHASVARCAKCFT